MDEKLPQAVPAYQQVKDYVTSRIQDGTWKQGELVPSEHDLVKQFSVSRMTVTRALRELTAEQLLIRVQGAGTFVAEQKYGSTAVSIRNIAEEVVARGHTYGCQVLALEAVFDPLACNALALAVSSACGGCVPAAPRCGPWPRTWADPTSGRCVRICHGPSTSSITSMSSNCSTKNSVLFAANSMPT